LKLLSFNLQLLGLDRINLTNYYAERRFCFCGSVVGEGVMVMLGVLLPEA
jgi:hypothetical protein